MSHGGTSWVPGPTLKAVQGTPQRESCTAFPTAFWWEVLLLSSQLPLAALLLASGSKGPALISERWLWDWLPSPCLGMWGAAGAHHCSSRVQGRQPPLPLPCRSSGHPSFLPSIHLLVHPCAPRIPSLLFQRPPAAATPETRQKGWVAGWAGGGNERAGT